MSLVKYDLNEQYKHLKEEASTPLKIDALLYQR